MAKLLKDKKSELKRDFSKQKKEAKERFKSQLTKNKLDVPRSVRMEAKKELKSTKKDYRLVRKDYKKTYKSLTLKKDGLTEKELADLFEKKKAVNQAKIAKKYQKKVHKKSVQGDSSLVRNQLKLETKGRVKQDLRYQTEQVLHGDDTLGEAAHQLNQVNRTRMNMRQSLKVTKQSAKLSGKVMKGTYGVGNRSFNLIRGRGFNRTPDDLTFANKTRQAKRRAKAYSQFKLNQSTLSLQKTIQGVEKAIVQGAKLVFVNPLTWLFLLIFMVIFMLVGGISASSRYAIYQEPKELTDSWVYLTKQDTEHNDGSNTFFTNPTDVMFYMNYKYEDYIYTDSASLTKKYSDILDDVWVSLNGESPDYSLSTMSDLMTDKNSPYYLKKEDYDDYKEVVSEYGFQTLDWQLSFPFKTEELTISRRYGYEGQKKDATLFKGIEADVVQNSDITAPLDGQITKLVGDNQVEITSEDTYRLTLKGVKNNRLEKGMSVSEGEFIGSATGNKLTITYDIQSEDEWQSVNPAFFFPKVSYTQQTTLSVGYETANLSPEIIMLIPKFKQAMKEIGMPEKFLPVVLAVCMQESGGRVPDVMQASESLGLPPNTLGTDESIKQGVKYLWDNMKLVGLDLINKDEAYVKTAVQAYNFGSGFISFAKSNGYVYTEQLAKDFSNKMSGGTGLYGDAQYVPHVWRYIQSGGGSASTSGKFAYPLPNKLNDISGFDYRYNPITGAYELHLGLDFPVPMGTPVYASEDATVMRNSDVGDTYGINVVLKHSKGGYWTRYAHLSRASVTVGSTVKRGQLVGYVGSTGASTGPHLHYEVMTSMYAGHVNPRPFIQ